MNLNSGAVARLETQALCESELHAAIVRSGVTAQ